MLPYSFEEFPLDRQSPVSVCKNYELLIMSCCLMQLMDAVSQNQKVERLIGLEKVCLEYL